MRSLLGEGVETHACESSFVIIGKRFILIETDDKSITGLQKYLNEVSRPRVEIRGGGGTVYLCSIMFELLLTSKATVVVSAACSVGVIYCFLPKACVPTTSVVQTHPATYVEEFSSERTYRHCQMHTIAYFRRSVKMLLPPRFRDGFEDYLEWYALRFSNSNPLYPLSQATLDWDFVPDTITSQFRTPKNWLEAEVKELIEAEFLISLGSSDSIPEININKSEVLDFFHEVLDVAGLIEFYPADCRISDVSPVVKEIISKYVLTAPVWNEIFTSWNAKKVSYGYPSANYKQMFRAVQTLGLKIC